MAILIATVLLVVGCKNLFEVGLGGKVDVEAPVVRLLYPAPGVFLRNTVGFSGTAVDDIAVAKVEISFDQGTTWTEVDEYDASTGLWTHNLDTTQRRDGRILVTVRATDTSSKTVVSDDTVFNIDNTPPVVLVTGPERYADLLFNTRAVITVTAADRHAVRRFGAVVEGSDDGGVTWKQLETREVT